VTADAMRLAVALVNGAQSFVVSGHIGPAGDALGSALAFAHAARAAGKQAVVAFGGPFVLPDSYSFLDTTPIVEAADLPADPDLMVVFDVGVSSRLGDLAEYASNVAKLLIVDHHPNPEEGFGDVQVIDTGAGAAAQLCANLIKDVGWAINETVGRCLLTGIVTDTGRFQYSSTDGDIMRIAAELLDAGVRPEMIGQAVYESVPFGYLSVSSAVLGRADRQGGRGGRPVEGDRRRFQGEHALAWCSRCRLDRRLGGGRGASQRSRLYDGRCCRGGHGAHQGVAAWLTDSFSSTSREALPLTTWSPGRGG